MGRPRLEAARIVAIGTGRGGAEADVAILGTGDDEVGRRIVASANRSKLRVECFPWHLSEVLGQRGLPDSRDSLTRRGFCDAGGGAVTVNGPLTMPGQLNCQRPIDAVHGR